MDKTSRPTDISREFLRDLENDHEPFCSRPWRTLKVTMTGQTKICCDFFTRLPEFDWPTAQDFHRPDGMWNHPYMQHLRRTMGTAEEVPFCTLCLTKDKRSPSHRAERIVAKAESLEVYRTFEDRTAADQYRGTLSANEPLEHHVVELANGRELRPFRRPATEYRRLVRAQGLLGRGRVLQIGAPVLAMAAFLAEANDHLTVTGPDAAVLERVRAVCSPFSLEPTTAPLGSDALLAASDDSFDAAWLDGSLFVQLDRDRLLAEVARVVRGDGALHVHRAPGPLTPKDLRHVLHACGLKFDVAMPVSQRDGSVSFSAVVPRARVLTDLPAPSLRPPRRPG